MRKVAHFLPFVLAATLGMGYGVAHAQQTTAPGGRALPFSQSGPAGSPQYDASFSYQDPTAQHQGALPGPAITCLGPDYDAQRQAWASSGYSSAAYPACSQVHGVYNGFNRPVETPIPGTYSTTANSPN